jgi:hypothetical protein
MRKAGSGTGPLREWAAPSYDPNTGRAAWSLGHGEATTIEGERIAPNRQMPRGQPGKGSPSLKEIDAQRCTDYTPVNKRPIG